MTPLLWAPGDRCVVEGEVCKVASVRDGFATVRRSNGMALYRPLADLELVPFAAQRLVADIERVFGDPATVSTLPPPPEVA